MTKKNIRNPYFLFFYLNIISKFITQISIMQMLVWPYKLRPLKLHVILEVRKLLYRVIHKSLRDFRTRLRNNQDRHDRKEHINR